MLAYMLQLSPDVDRLRHLVQKRLMDPKRLGPAEKHLHQMLRILHAAGIVRLEPEPPPPETDKPAAGAAPGPAQPPPAAKPSAFAKLMIEALQAQHKATGEGPVPIGPGTGEPAVVEYRPERAIPTARMADFFIFRSVNPLYALFLLDQFALADPIERLQAFESVLELPKSLLRAVRVPNPERLPPGSLARNYLDTELVTRGLITAGDLYPEWDPDLPPEERKYAPPLGDKLKMLFDATYPGVHGLFVQPVWAVGELLNFECNFQNYIGSRDLAKQEGLIFRHVLRLILLLGEFAQVVPAGIDAATWRTELKTLADRLTACCREVDPTSTEYMLAHAADQDILVHEPPTGTVPSPVSETQLAAENAGTTLAPAAEPTTDEPTPVADDFGTGIAESE
jgi:hypothetical protein